MMNTLFPATHSFVKQGPNYRPLDKSTQLILEGQPLSTPPVAQEYFEPGVNVKLQRRSKPKTDYTLPSDMPEYSPGFVPVNKTPGAFGEEPPRIVVKESVPQDLMDVFKRISAEEQAAKQTLPEAKIDRGSRTTRAYQKALKAARESMKVDSMVERGFTEDEAKKAIGVLREEEAIKEARMPAAPISVEEALKGVFGVPNVPGENPSPP